MVVGVVVKVTHHNDFRLRILQVQTIANLARQHGSGIAWRTAGFLATVAAGPVVHDDVYLLQWLRTQNITRYHQLQTGLYHAAIGIVGFELVALCVGYLEHIGVIQETYIYTTTVRTLNKDGLVGASHLLHRGTEVFEAMDVLHLRYAHAHRSARVYLQT